MIEVAAGIIHHTDGRILIARKRQGKPQAGLWEFPGGKLEAEEDAPQCLRRELMEEMNIAIRPYEAYGVTVHSYGSLQIRLTAWRAEYLSGDIRLSDHDAYDWVLPGELDRYVFAPADVPFVQKLLEES